MNNTFTTVKCAIFSLKTLIKIYCIRNHHYRKNPSFFGQMIVSIDGICLKIFESTFLCFEPCYKAVFKNKNITTFWFDIPQIPKK